MDNNAKKVIVINGSPRREESVSLVATNMFLNGIKAAVPCEVEFITVSDMNIKPCMGCLSCWARTEGECVIRDDDILAIKNKILDSDIVIVSYPLYFFGMPGTMKVFTDRMLSMMKTYAGQPASLTGESLHGIRYPKNGRNFVVISTCAYTEVNGAYDALKCQYDCICGRGNYTAVLVPQLKMFLASAKGERLEKYKKKFEEAGRMLALEGKIPDETLAELSQPPFTERTYKYLLANFWDNQRKGL